MRKAFILSILVTISYFTNAQQCNGTSQVVLLGAKNSGVFHQLHMDSNGPHNNDPNSGEVLVAAWTCNGSGFPICNERETLKYKLTQIPKQASIISAKLYLYAKLNTTFAYVGHPTYNAGLGNEVSIKRVTNGWDTTGLNYGFVDQTTTDEYQVILPSSTNDAQDYVADIKDLVQFWIENPDSNFGMQFKHIDETYYRSMIFHGSSSPASVQPRLEICYITEENYPKVFGTAYYDANANGIQDSTEVVAPYVKVALSNGSFTFTDVNGYYEIASSIFGNYDVTITPPNFYTASNLTSNFNFSGYGVSYQNNVGFTATSNTDSVNIHIIPFHRFARPGFAFPCFIEYENLGNTLLTPTLGVDYDSAKVQYDSCSNIAIQNLGSVFGGTVSNIKPGERHFFTTYLTTKTTAQIGDPLPFFAAINAGTATAVDQVLVPVNASYDPNDKEATAILTPQQVALGNYIDYTIRFENIGNDTAYNIVIKDTLSSLLQANTLQIISSSHACRLTVNDNKIKVDFKNIKLLYTSLNALKSLGFVKFRVKPIATVTNGTVINNKASIYFDYNKPIVTNTATTLIKNPSVLPVKITSYKLNVTTEKQVENIWKTTNEINVSYFNVQRSLNGKDFEIINKVVANNKTNNEYYFIDKQPATYTGFTILYYRIQSVDKDGKISYTNSIKVTLNNNQQLVNIYPNPAKDIVNIECANAKQLLIVDYLGRTVYQSTVNNQLSTVNTKNFVKGIYVVKAILNNGEIKTAKLIKE